MTAAAGRMGSLLALARCIAVRSTYSELELYDPVHAADPPDSGSDAPIGRAVIPHSRLAALDAAHWPPRGGIHVRAGGGIPLQAVRDDSPFLRLLCEHLLGVRVHAELFRGVGMIAMNPHADLGPVIGPQGRTAGQIRSLAGLRQLYVVRHPAVGHKSSLPSRAVEERRLRAALRSFGVRGYELSPPPQDLSPWTIHTGPAAARHVRGSGGTKMMFIARLAGVAIRIQDGEAL
jgi:hypothetical protein